MNMSGYLVLEGETSFFGWIEDNIFLVMGIMGGVLVLLVVLLLLVHSSRKKKKETEAAAEAARKTAAEEARIKEEAAAAEQQKKRAEGLVITLSAEGIGKKELVLSKSEYLMVGRGDTCDLQLPEPECSRQQFKLETDGADVYLSDMNTTNGTKLNGVPLRHKRRVVSGDRIGVGNTEIEIRW